MSTILLAALLLAAPDLTVPTADLVWKKGVVLKEGTRGIGDEFPYLAVGGNNLTPETVAKHLKDQIKDGKAAMAAVRLFAAGPLVHDKETVGRISSAAFQLKKQLKHLDVRISKHRPQSCKPVIKALDDGWRIEFVAFEMDRMLQLVQIKANVKATGRIEIHRDVFIKGPMTIWQSAMVVDDDREAQEAALRKHREMLAEALAARQVYAKALRPGLDLDTAWALSRLRLTQPQIQDLWGEPKRLSGIRHGFWYAIADVGTAHFRAVDPKRSVENFRLFPTGESKPTLFAK